MTDSASQTIQKIAAYFNDCFQADNRAHSLWDVFADKNEWLRVCSTEQTAALKQNGVCGLDAVYGSQLEKNVAIYRREKMLLYGQLFVSAQLPIGGGLSKKLTRICAPLLFYEASVNSFNNRYELSIDRSMVRWNSPLLSILFEEKDIEHQLQSLLTVRGQLDPVDFKELLRAPNHVVSECKVLEPITEVAQLQAAKNASQSQRLIVASGGCFVFTQRSRASRGIIDELNVMSDSHKISRACQRLFGMPLKERNTHLNAQLEHVPGILSGAQQQALKNAASKDLSVLIGPPGTGKSYTIACIMLERFLRGESVLLVTQNEAAVDVVHEKLTEYLGICASAIIRSGSKNYHYELKSKLEDILSGVSYSSGPGYRRLLLDDIKKALKKAEKRFRQEAKQAVGDGLLLDGLNSGRIKNHWINRIKRWLAMVRVSKQQPLAEQLSDIHELHAKRELTLADMINKKYQTTLRTFLNKHRKHLVKFDSALRARTSQGQLSRFSDVDHEILLQAFPMWLCSLSALHRSLPLKTELFDLVIIDEATQCDIASCLPAIQRANRVMVVGDPKQLRHLSFLAGKKQQKILESHDLQQFSLNLNYRDQSMIDLATAQAGTQESVVVLDEHYRSTPDIIGFSNAHFYRNQLRIMTAKPNTSQKASVRLVDVVGGTRQAGVNKEEIKQVFKKLDEVLLFQRQLPVENRQSIGLLAFFREQAETMQKLLLKHCDVKTLREHKIRAATPYGFQGEERDIMLISCGVDADTPAGAFKYLDRPDVFNVAITRARVLQFVFVSVASELMPKNGLLEQFIQYIKNLKTEPFAELPRLHEHLDDLCQGLEALGLKTIHHHTVAGIMMDLVVVYKDQVLAIDLIGFPGEHQDVLHMDRYQMFGRAELEVHPLSLSAWMHDKDAVLQAVKKKLESMHQKSLRSLSISFRARNWKNVNQYDPLLAKFIRKVEFSLNEGEHIECIKQLKQLIGLYVNLRFRLSQVFRPNELTSLRYRDSFNRIMKHCLRGYQGILRQQGAEQAQSITKVLADNQIAIDKLKQAESRINAVVSRQPFKGFSHVEMSYDFTGLDQLNEKVSQFNDMDDL